ncbi:carbohydrate-binding protein [Candidatus Pelagibacter communis]|uniref:carbohydrate-binding protein n=1 Tax=Pelagibacter ubique TaxID=198252 RepID=UPI00094C0122|nr:carbohydrate-binding protein [Candidatus Pelagibacter ubique]
MATINLGNIKFNWKGTYNAGTAYAIDDVVSYNGSSYVCILASTGNLPTNTTYWNVMSSAGTNGTDGTDLTTTLTTQGDIVYRDGSGLARLGAGTSGQVLQTGGTGANPSWGTVSSDYVKVANGTLSNQGDLILNNFDFTTYKHFKVYLNGVNTNNNSEYLAIRFQYDNSGSPATDTGSEYTYFLKGRHVYGSSSDTGENSGTSLQDRIRTNWQTTATSNGASWKQDFQFELSNWNNTNSSKQLFIRMCGVYDNGTEYHYYLDGGAVSRNDTRAYNGLRFFLNNSNNFNVDNYYIYGIKG